MDEQLIFEMLTAPCSSILGDYDVCVGDNHENDGDDRTKQQHPPKVMTPFPTSLTAITSRTAVIEPQQPLEYRVDDECTNNTERNPMDCFYDNSNNSNFDRIPDPIDIYFQQQRYSPETEQPCQQPDETSDINVSVSTALVLPGAETVATTPLPPPPNIFSICSKPSNKFVAGATAATSLPLEMKNQLDGLSMAVTAKSQTRWPFFHYVDHSQASVATSSQHQCLSQPSIATSLMDTAVPSSKAAAVAQQQSVLS